MAVIVREKNSAEKFYLIGSYSFGEFGHAKFILADMNGNIREDRALLYEVVQIDEVIFEEHEAE